MAILGGSGVLRIGLAVGWLVGAWLFGPKQKKNEIFDPGAEEMPRWNTSLRGITMPVAFGTNRISSQMCWQHDYTVTRAEDGSSGGKFGGSGGGKAQQSSGNSYNYKWDMIFHLAMVPTKVNMIKGWLGATRLNDNTINAIINSTAGSIEFVGGDQKNSQQDEVSMKFQDAFFYKGSGPGLAGDTPEDLDAGWNEVLTDEGMPIRWPHTSWVGFKQLDLGTSPAIPQLSFEIGPGEVTVTDTATNGIVVTGDTNSSSSTVYSRYILGMSAQITGEDGNKYIMVSQSLTTGKEVLIYRIDFANETAVLTQTITDADFDVYRIALGITPPHIENGVDVIELCAGAALHPKNYFFVTGFLTGDIVYDYLVGMLFKINSLGLLEAIGGGSKRWNLSTPRLPKVHLHIAIANDQGDTDPIILVAHFGSTSTSYPSFWIFPSLDRHRQGTPYEMDDVTNNYDSAILTGLDHHWANWSSYREFTPYFWTDGITGTTRLWYYIGPSDIAMYADGGTRQSPRMNSLAPTTAKIGCWDLGVLGQHTVDGVGSEEGNGIGATLVDGIVTGAPTDWTNGFEEFPFPDAGLYANGTTSESPNKYRGDYDPKPSVYELQTGQYAGFWMFIFTQMLEDETVDQINDGIHSTWARSRAYIYNPLLDSFVLIKTIEYEPIDRAADWGGSDATLFHSRCRQAIYDDVTGTALMFGHTFGSLTNAKKFFISGAWTDLSLQGGQDVYPPYIVYEILTNPFFGVSQYITIDNTSYLAAVQYCVTNNFKVSVQFRREQGVLEAIDDVLSTYGGFLSISNGIVKFKQLEYLDGAASPVRTIDNHHLKAEPGTPPVKVTKGAMQDTFNKVRVNYYDRALEYAQNQVEEADEVDQDINGIRMREFPAIFTMEEGMARTMAVRALWSNLYARDSYDFTLGWKDQDLEPGDVITLVDSYHPALSNGVTCRIITWKESKRGSFDVTAKQEFEYILTASGDTLDITSASFTSRAGAEPVVRDFTMYEVPQAMDGETPNLFVGWSTWNFASGADLYVSTDGTTYARAQHVEPYQIAAQLIGGLPADDDINENVEVVMYPTSDYYSTGSVNYITTLGAAGQQSRAAGAALMWVGSEMIAYEGVTLVSQNRYRFDKVFRGWGGTNYHAHSSGDTMYKHGGGVFKQELMKNKIGTTIYYKVRPHNFYGAGPDISSIAAKNYVIKGTGWLPANAATVQFANSGFARGVTRDWVGSTVDIAIGWKDTALERGFGMLGNGYGGYGAFAQDSHSFRVEVYGSGGVVVRSTFTSSTDFTYTSAMNIADNGAWRGNCAFKVTPYNTIGDALVPNVCSLELWQ